MRSSPASSFKLPLALMGYASGILESPHAPVWKYQPAYEAWNETWKRDTDPTAWLRDSVVWYSQQLTRTLGMPAFQLYVDQFGYGNRNLQGDPGASNGLTHSWLSSSLQVSPDEQIAFLLKLRKRELGVPAPAYDMTQAAMPVFNAGKGWTVRGKTGTGFQKQVDGRIDRKRQFGWFVGWATRDDRSIVFARLVRDTDKQSAPAGLRARDTLLADLPAWLPAE